MEWKYSRLCLFAIRCRREQSGKIRPSYNFLASQNDDTFGSCTTYLAIEHRPLRHLPNFVNFLPNLLPAKIGVPPYLGGLLVEFDALLEQHTSATWWVSACSCLEAAKSVRSSSLDLDLGGVPAAGQQTSSFPLMSSFRGLLSNDLRLHYCLPIVDLMWGFRLLLVLERFEPVENLEILNWWVQMGCRSFFEVQILPLHHCSCLSVA